MKKIIIIMSILTVSFANLKGQDTIYSYYFPKGIITPEIKSLRTWYIFNPINNPTTKITISKESTSKIIYQNGEIFINPNPIKYAEDKVVFQTDPLTGKININEIVEISGARKKELYNSVKTLPQGIIKYYLIASDDSDYSFLKYVGRFPVTYAGDPYILYFNLLVRIKDGKVKYEYSDFVATFSETKSKQSPNIFEAFSNGVNSSIKEHTINLDDLYAKPSKSDKRTFWEPIYDNINASINSLKKICSEASPNNKDGW